MEVKTLQRLALEKVLETDINLLKEKPFCNIYKKYGMERYLPI
jgi:hypothetical protein